MLKLSDVIELIENHERIISITVTLRDVEKELKPKGKRFTLKELQGLQALESQGLLKVKAYEGLLNLDGLF